MTLYAMKAGGVTKAIVDLDMVQLIFIDVNTPPQDISIWFKGEAQPYSISFSPEEIEEIMNALSEHITAPSRVSVEAKSAP